MKIHLKVLPKCFGSHEPSNQFCADTCKQNNECVALQLRMEQKGTKASTYLIKTADSAGNKYATPKDPEKLSRIIAKTIEAHEIKEGVVGKRLVLMAPRGATANRPNKNLLAREEGRKKKNRGTHKELSGAVAESSLRRIRRKGRPPAKQRSPAAIELDDVMKGWLRALVKGTGRPLVLDEALAKPGELIIRDRRIAGRYVSVYAKGVTYKKDFPLCLIEYKTRTGTVDVKFPLEPGDFDGISRSTMKALKPIAHSDGVFRSISKSLDRAGAVMSAEAVVKLVEQRIIPLPDIG